MRYFEDEAWWAAVTASHLLEQDCVDAQTGGRVGRLAQETRGQARVSVGVRVRGGNRKQPQPVTQQHARGGAKM